MAAANTDYFTEVGNPGSATTLSAPGHTIAGTTFNVVSTSNWPTLTGGIFAVDTYTLQTVNGVPNTAVRTPGSYTEWEGTVASATSITNAVLRYGTDQNYSAGSLTRVYIPVASSRENRLVQGLQVSLNQDGSMKGSAINTGLAATPLATAGIATNAVTGDKLATSAITLGYTQITSNITTTSTSQTQATGLTSTVTVPAGGRRVKITFFGNVQTNTNVHKTTVTIWDGTVGSGTQLGAATTIVQNSGNDQFIQCQAIVTPAAGSKTYNIGWNSDSGAVTWTMSASATQPVFILVELI